MRKAIIGLLLGISWSGQSEIRRDRIFEWAMDNERLARTIIATAEGSPNPVSGTSILWKVETKPGNAIEGWMFPSHDGAAVTSRAWKYEEDTFFGALLAARRRNPDGDVREVALAVKRTRLRSENVPLADLLSTIEKCTRTCPPPYHGSPGGYWVDEFDIQIVKNGTTTRALYNESVGDNSHPWSSVLRNLHAKLVPEDADSPGK